MVLAQEPTDKLLRTEPAARLMAGSEERSSAAAPLSTVCMRELNVEHIMTISQHPVNMFSMASRQDLDNWVELGNKGWGFSDLLPYYIKSETYRPTAEAFADKVDDKYLDASLRGTSGPIHVSHYMPFPSCILTSLGLPTRRRAHLATGCMAQDTTQCRIRAMQRPPNWLRNRWLQSAGHG
jgi:hypothetical protein